MKGPAVNPTPAQQPAAGRAVQLLSDAYRLHRMSRNDPNYPCQRSMWESDREAEREQAAEDAPTLALLAIGHALAAAIPDERQAALQAEANAARAELARTDAKAGIALATAGTTFSVLAALGTLARVSAYAQVGIWAAMTVLAAACGMLLWVIRPVIPRTGGVGFVAHARLGTAEELLAALDAESTRERLADEVVLLSRLARAKYRRLRAGINLMFAALVILVVTIPFGG